MRILSIIMALLMVVACSGKSTNMSSRGTGAKSSSYASKKDTRNHGFINKYLVASEKLEPFSIMPGSRGDAKASDRIFFDYDSAVISRDQQRTLDRQVAWLKNNPSATLTVEGHCDERGTREYNLSLGARRAQAIKNYLVAAGVDRSRVTTVSYGKERPAILGSSNASYAENRRGVSVLR